MVPQGGTAPGAQAAVQAKILPGLVVGAVTTGTPANLDKNIDFPQGQNQGPYVIGEERWQQIYLKTFKGQNVDRRSWTRLVPRQPVPDGRWRVLRRAVRILLLEECSRLAGTHQLRCLRAICHYVRLPCDNRADVTITETLDAYHGTPDYTKEGGVDWANRLLRERRKGLHERVAEARHELEHGADGTALAWG